MPNDQNYLLLIDTSKEQALVALVRDKNVVTQRKWKNDQHTGRKLLSAIDKVLKRNKLAVEDIRRIAVHTGPGGYSSLRAGTVTAQMMSMAHNIGIVGVTGDKVEDMIGKALDGRPTDVVMPRYEK